MTSNNALNSSFSGSIIGTATNNNAASGIVGELISSTIASGSAISLTNNTAANVTSISLTAGDWDVYGNVFVSYTTTGTFAYAWVSTASATLPDISLAGGSPLVVIGAGIDAPYVRLSLASTTTVYLSARASFTVGTATACGGIYARRAR